MGRRSGKSMIGLKRGTVKLIRHNPKWRQNFEREEKKLKKVFGRDALKIQHVGSTAIPGILAKPIIDIALIVLSLQKARCYERKLKEIGYKIKKNDTKRERLFFTKGSEKRRTHYLHISEIGSGYAEDMILFRDYLRNHKDVAKKYSELKEKLAEKYPKAREIYAVQKEKLIEETVKKAKRSIRIQKKVSQKTMKGPSLQAIEDYYYRHGLRGSKLRKATENDREFMKILKERWSNLTQKFSVKPQDRKRYILSTDEDYLILGKIYELERKKLSDKDKALVKLVRTQLEHHWRTPIIRFLNRLLKKYS